MANPDRVANQEKVFEVLSENKDKYGWVNNPVALCAEKLPRIGKNCITGFFKLLEQRGAIIVFRRGVVTNNGGVIRRVKVLSKVYPADHRALIKW